MVESTYDLMVDIETLDTVPGAVVLQAGAVKFLPTDTKILADDLFQWSLDWTNYEQDRRSISPSTVRFWGLQKEATRRTVWYDGRRISADMMFETLWPLIAGARHLWARSPSFDYEIIFDLYIDRMTHAGDGEVYARVDQQRRKYRDERVLRDLILGFNVKLPENPLAHDALSDAMHQVAVVQAAYNALRSKS